MADDTDSELYMDGPDTAPEGGAFHSAGQPPSDHNMLADLWHDHKGWIMVAIGGLTLLVTIYAVWSNQGQTNANNNTTSAPGTLATDNGTPTAYTSDTSSGLSSLTSYLQSLQESLQQLMAGGGVSGLGSSAAATTGGSSGSSGATATSTTTGGSSANSTGSGASNAGASPTPPISQPVAATPQFVTVTPWTAQNTSWSSTLGGIAAHEGEALSRVEALNPQIANPNLIYSGQEVRVS